MSAERITEIQPEGMFPEDMAIWADMNSQQQITQSDGMYMFRGSQDIRSIFSEPIEGDYKLKTALQANLELQALLMTKLTQIMRQKNKIRDQLADLKEPGRHDKPV
jgi:hypothetical protein